VSDYTYRITPVDEPRPRAIEMNGTAPALTEVSAGDAVTLTWAPRRYDLGSPVGRRARTLKPARHYFRSWVTLTNALNAWRYRQPPKGGWAAEFYSVER